MPYLQATNIKLINLKWHLNTKHNKKAKNNITALRNVPIGWCNKMKLKFLDSDSFHTCKH